MWTFLIMLVPLFAATSLAIPARRTYLGDVCEADVRIALKQVKKPGAFLA
jgi:hypothetical protein